MELLIKNDFREMNIGYVNVKLFKFVEIVVKFVKIAILF